MEPKYFLQQLVFARNSFQGGETYRLGRVSRRGSGLNVDTGKVEPKYEFVPKDKRFKPYLSLESDIRPAPLHLG